MNNICKECRQSLASDETECPCGFKKAIMKNDYQCRYVMSNEKRCQNSGSVALQLRGNVWYCSGHVHQVMRDMEIRHQAYLKMPMNQEECHESI